MEYKNASLLTKKALSNALCTLMSNTPYNKISISSITKECGLNRKTFYYHFKDKDELLRWTIEHDAEAKMKSLNIIDNFNFKDIVIYTMDFLEKNETFVADTLNSINTEEYKRIFIDDIIKAMEIIIREHEQQNNVTLKNDYRDFLSRFFAESIAEMILYRLNNKQTLGKEKTIEYFTSSVEAALTGIMRQAVKDNTQTTNTSSRA